MTNIWAIILNYNGRKYLNASISSLLDSETSNLKLTVLIVDNASSDISYKFAQTKFAQIDNVKFIKNSTNFGFSTGNNVGIREALANGAEFVFLLNNDAVVKPDTLRKLLDAAKKQTHPSVLCPIITDADENIWYAGGKINWWRMRAGHLQKPTHPTKTYPTQFATGAAVLINTRIFAQIGLWDEAYFLYYEDADFSIRAKLAGCFVGVVPTAYAIHHEVSARTQFSATKTYWLVRSGTRFFATHASAILRKFWYPILINLRKIKNHLDTILRKSEITSAVARAWRDNAKDNQSNYKTKIPTSPPAMNQPNPNSSQSPTLNIQIVYYQGLDHLQNCLKSLAKHAQFAQKIIIVNHSGQKIDNDLRKFDNLCIINQPNHGFGAGHNAAAIHTDSDIILCLNPDTILTESIAPLLAPFSDAQVAAIGAKLVTSKNQQHPHIHGKTPTIWQLLTNHLRSHHPDYHTRQTDWVSGGAMIVRRTDFAQIGGFDENFFLYFEDVDLCIRLRKLGKKILFVPTISITHIGGTSFQNRHHQKIHYDTSQDYYFAKHHSKTHTLSARILRKLWRTLRK